MLGSTGEIQQHISSNQNNWAKKLRLQSLASQKWNQVGLDTKFREIEHDLSDKEFHVVSDSIQEVHLQNLFHFSLELVEKVSLNLVNGKERLNDIGSERAE